MGAPPLPRTAAPGPGLTLSKEQLLETHLGRAHPQEQFQVGGWTLTPGIRDALGPSLYTPSLTDDNTHCCSTNTQNS